MAHLTYTLKLLQIRGRKGKALHKAMQQWTLAQTEFLDHCASKVEEFEAACTKETARGVRRSNLSLQKWIRREIKPFQSYTALESSMKDSLIAQLGGQLMSFLELQEVQENTGFPSGRGHNEADFEQYLENFIQRDWTCWKDADMEEINLEYATIQGKVQGYRTKVKYSPIEFCRYDTRRNYCLVRSEDGQLFAALYLTTEDTGFRLNGKPLTVVGKNVPLKSLSKKAALFPLATGRWTLRKLEKYRPETARLIYRDGDFYLHVALHVPDSEPKPYQTLLGIDMGKNRLASIAVLSEDGGEIIHTESFGTSGLHQKRINEINAKIKKAQTNGGHYRYPKYKKLNEEIVNEIANKLLSLAKKYRSKIVFEDLESLMRTRMAKSGKSNFNKGRKSNIYAELLRVLDYKAGILGIQMDKIGAAYTSQTCPMCGYIDRNNRLTKKGTGSSRLYFNCKSCGFEHKDADVVAAVNIARKSLYKAACKEAKNKQADKISWHDFARSVCSA